MKSRSKTLRIVLVALLYNWWKLILIISIIFFRIYILIFFNSFLILFWFHLIIYYISLKIHITIKKETLFFLCKRVCFKYHFHSFNFSPTQLLFNLLKVLKIMYGLYYIWNSKYVIKSTETSNIIFSFVSTFEVSQIYHLDNKIS